MIRNYNVDEFFYKKGKILVVDDNKFIANSVKKIVESALKELNSDYEVIVGSDGIDLIGNMRQDQGNGNLIKCVITDENMEFMNGSEAVKIVRNLERKGLIKPVTIFTSTCHEDESTCKLILDAGSQILLPKPLCISNVIRSFIDYKII